MPSAFIVSQAEILKRTQDCFVVLQNIRDKYALSSFPSQMTRVKDEWMKLNDRHPDFKKSFDRGLKTLKTQGISSRFISQYIEFGNDSMKDQLKKMKLAEKQSLTGSTRTDRQIANIQIFPDYMNDYRLSKEDMIKNEKLVTRCIEQRAMDCVVVENANDLVERCKAIVKGLEDDVFITAAAVSVLCGRRSIEILKIGKFSSSTKGSHAAVFSGAAKKRAISCEKADIPLLIKYKYLKDAISYIRETLDVKSLTNDKINSKFSHKLGDAAKILMDCLTMRFHDLRAVYGSISHQAFENTWSINIWLKKVLMHDNIDTSVFYSRCKVSSCDIALGKWN